MQIPLLGADGEAECGDEQNSRSNPGGSLTRGGRCRGSEEQLRGGKGAGEGDVDEAPRQRLVCPGHSRREPEEASGACAEPDNPAGRTRGCAGGARREHHFGGGEGRDSKDPRQTGKVTAGSRAD